MAHSQKQNNALWPVSVSTFLNYAARGLTQPFIGLYLVSIGYTGFELGLILSLSALVRLILTPLMHTWADELGRHRQLYYALVLGNVVSSLTVVAGGPKLWLGGAVIVRDTMDGPSASILSQLTITKLSQVKRDIYGQIRSWGSLGWAVTTLVSGAIFNLGGYALLFAASVALNVLALPFGKSMPERTVEKDSPVNENAAPVKRQAAFYVLMGATFLLFIGMGMSQGFANVYFQQDLGADNTLIGIITSISALAEVPVMILMDRLLHRFNIRYLLIFGFLGTALYWFATSLLTDTTYLLPVVVSRAFSYTPQTIALTLLVDRISHPSNAATNQAISQVTIPAFAQLVSGIFAGWVFDNLGGTVLFQMAGTVGVIATLILFFGRGLLAKSRTNQPSMA
jgi:PPP family 3-phenylpropionic acid transporter